MEAKFITYHTEGRRAFLLDEDGATICELVAPGANNPVPIAVDLVRRWNSHEQILNALRSVMLCEFNSMSSRQEMIRLARQAIDNAY